LDGEEIDFVDYISVVLDIWDFTHGNRLDIRIVMRSSSKSVTFGLVVIEK